MQCNKITVENFRNIETAEVSFSPRVNLLLGDNAQGKTNITANDIENELYTSGIPDPDLIVRTAGEMRLSNFLMWQSAYSEFYFTDTLWPDMSSKDIDLAVKEFYNRQRRYGKV